MNVFKQLLLVLMLLFTQFVSAQSPSQLPDFSFQEYFTDKSFRPIDLPKDGLFVLNFYETGCGHCQKMAAGIAENLNAFKNVKFYFISMNDKPYVEGFINMFAKRLKSSSQVTFVWDKNIQFIPLFNPTQTPSLYIYDAKTRKLLQHLDGVEDVKRLQAAIAQVSN